MNNHLEQAHKGITQRAHPMCGFKHFGSAARFCRVYEEVRNFYHHCTECTRCARP